MYYYIDPSPHCVQITTIYADSGYIEYFIAPRCLNLSLRDISSFCGSSKFCELLFYSISPRRLEEVISTKLYYKINQLISLYTM